MNDRILHSILMVKNTLFGPRDEKGASAVEYGLLVAGIAAVIVAVVFLLGGVINNAFSNTCTAVNNNTACS